MVSPATDAVPVGFLPVYHCVLTFSCSWLGLLVSLAQAVYVTNVPFAKVSAGEAHEETPLKTFSGKRTVHSLVSLPTLFHSSVMGSRSSVNSKSSDD
jgi:hypothetical protein